MCDYDYSPTLVAGKQKNSAHQKFFRRYPTLSPPLDTHQIPPRRPESDKPSGKTQSSDEESGIAMRRENAKMFGFQPIGVFL
jgi:hypothetical protein